MSEKSVEQLRAEIAASRERLAGTIDELTTRAAPKALMQRQSEAAKQRFAARLAVLDAAFHCAHASSLLPGLIKAAIIPPRPGPHPQRRRGPTGNRPVCRLGPTP